MSEVARPAAGLSFSPTRRQGAGPAAFPRALLALCALLGLLVGTTGSALATAARPTVQGVSEGLTCQCGCGLTVANCNHPHCEFSVPVRGQIGKMIQSGMSKVQIVAFFRAKYGEKVLSAPTTHGFNLLAWTMPFVAVVLGGVLVVFTAGRWRRSDSKPSADSAPASPDALPAGSFDERLRQKLKKEMQDQL